MAADLSPLPVPDGPSVRSSATYAPLPKLSQPFRLNDALAYNYKTQYANIYFLRLLGLRGQVSKRAKARWSGVKGSPRQLERILHVQRAQLCWAVGTVYMDMPLKPNVLEDMGRDHWVAPPPPRPKYYSPQDVIHLEDESGRVTLVGDRIKQEAEMAGGGLVTGVVMAVLGMETASGDFEVIDICFAGLPDMAAHSSDPSNKITQSVDSSSTKKGSLGKGKGKTKAELAVADDDGDVQMESMDKAAETTKEPVWVAIVSGISAGSSDVPEDLKSQLLTEWLMGEAGGSQDQLDGAKVAHVILAGNSLAAPVKNEDDRKPRRYGYDASLYTPHPTITLDAMLVDILSAGLPIHIVPGPQDPVGVTLPQQPFPRAMLRNASMGGGDALKMHTNPGWFELNGKSFLGTGGQTIDDVYKYIPSEDRLAMAQRTLEWRHIAPTAPDTLWCFPFADKDPFIIDRRPHVYFIGNQPSFETTVVGADTESGELTRIILLPKFAETGLVALVNIASETLECKTVQISVPEWELEKVKVTMTEEEIEKARANAAIVTSDLDMMADGNEW